MIKPRATVRTMLAAARDEEPIANDDRRDHREAREDQAAVGQAGSESPKCPVFWLVCSSRIRGTIETAVAEERRLWRRRSTWSPDRTKPHRGRSTRTGPSDPDPRSLRPSFAPLQLPCTLNAMPRVGNRLEPRLRDRLAAFHALAERPLLHPTQRLVDQSQRPLLVLDQAQRELLIVIVRAEVGHVQRHVREIARRSGIVPPRASSVIWSRSPRSRARRFSSISR